MQVFARYLTGVFNARNNRVTLSSSFANYWWWYKHYFLAVGSEEGDSLDPKASDDAKALMMWVKSVLAKYWILLCCGAFLLVGLQNEVSVYQIGYMAIFLFILICYQVSRSYICINYFSGYHIYIYIYIYILKVSNRGAQKISGEAERGFAGTVSFFTWFVAAGFDDPAPIFILGTLKNDCYGRY